MQYWEAFTENGKSIVSKPGVYQGYSKILYDGYERFSEYVTMRDGVKLAVDYYRPTLGGKPAETPLPVIWRFTPYGRVLYYEDGKTLKNMCAFSAEGLNGRKLGDGKDIYCQGLPANAPDTLAELFVKEFTARGYIVAQADVRGKYASYGWRPYTNPPCEAQDGYEINEWLASQSWCSGKTGMFGSSYTGQTQLNTIRMKPPHLKAAMVCMTDFDKFEHRVRGGISRCGRMLVAPDVTANAVPVDADRDGSMLKAAVSEHAKTDVYYVTDKYNINGYEIHTPPYRDSYCAMSDTRHWECESPSTYKDNINDSGVAMYLIGGWFDVFRKQTMVLYNNLTVPKKLIVGPWFHTKPKTELNLLIEHLRFYDYWLKGIDNGVMSEKPVYYSTVNAAGEGWEFSDVWPVKSAKKLTFFLRENGGLSAQPCKTEGEYDEYLSDYSINDIDEDEYANEILSKGLTYTSDALESDLRVTGHPLFTLNFTSSGRDGDFFTFLLDIDESGKARMVSNGVLRASMRLTENAPYNNLGIPWHPCRERDAQFLPENMQKPIRLEIDFIPTSYVFKKGHRLCAAITSSLNGILFYREPHEPSVKLYRDLKYPSFIEFPVCR